LWVAKHLERHHADIQVKLCGIETLGDQILTSLQKMEGKEFFVAEVDEALRSQRVDMTVHSMKDLSLDRPEDFVLACVPARENPRDIVVFGPKIGDSLRAHQVLKMGTSSPRRLENTPSFLEKALPRFHKTLPIAWEEIRGNVTTRLERLHAPSERHLDGVVLAFAGLIRLWQDAEGQKALSPLLQGVRFMVLPFSECPAAPSQGALAVECLKKNTWMQEKLRCLHDPQTAHFVQMERAFLAQVGGGCHQRFGVSVIGSSELGWILRARGLTTDGAVIDSLRWQSQESLGAEGALGWDGSQCSPEIDMLPHALDSCDHRALFIAHARALPQYASDLQDRRIWTSGVKSWFRLAQRGVWVEGCAEGLGFEACLSTLQEPVLGLPPLSQWLVLTHADAQDAWKDQGMQVLAPYRVRYPCSEEQKLRLQTSTHFFWGSGFQYDHFHAWVSPSAEHACGPGKTALHLRQKGLFPRVFPEPGEWRAWIKNLP